MNIKKLYLSKDMIYETALIPLNELIDFKLRYNALLNEQESTDYRKVYILDNQDILQETNYKASVYSKECYDNLIIKFETKLNERPSTISVDEDFILKIDDLINKLGDFMDIDLKKFDKSLESLKLVSSFFENFDSSMWLADDLSQPLTAYIGEIILKLYPNSEWRLEKHKSVRKIAYRPYILINGKVKSTDFFFSIFEYLGAIDDNKFSSLYDIYKGQISGINYELSWDK